MPYTLPNEGLRLAPTVRPMAEQLQGSVRKALKTISESGFSAVQLDATMPGLRPRELDASARRDLVSTASRSGLTIGGVDFFIPSDHYHDSAHLDRAAQAAVAACRFAGDLGRVPLTINLPIATVDATLVEDLITTAEVCGTPLVVTDNAASDELTNWIRSRDSGLLTAGIDPASQLIARIDPIKSVQSLPPLLGVARLSDARKGQADSRCPVGQGDLDLLAFRVSVEMAAPMHQSVVVDLRSLASPSHAAGACLRAWTGVVP